MKPAVVLAVGAHPDDIDFGAGGTLASFAAGGADIHYLQLTDGGSGTENRELTPAELSATREAEQRCACDEIQGKSVTFLRYPDGHLEVTQALKRDIAKVIRTTKPDVVITIDPGMLYAVDMGFINHPDHRAAGQATLDAVYPLARDHLAFPDLLEQGLEPHKVKTVLLTNFTNHNYYHDISDTIETKLAMVRAHASQLPDYDQMAELFTSMASELGAKANYRYAEGFLRIDIK